MKTATKLLLGFAVALSMVLFACSKDEPTPTQQEEDTPVMPEHPSKDWKGEAAHGFITDATVICLPISDRGFLMFGDKDEISMDQTNAESSNLSSTSKSFVNYGDYTMNFSRFWLDGVYADPFENQENYINICKQNRFRPNSQFSQFEELIGFKTPNIRGYFNLEELTSVDIITEKYYDKNHPAGCSMKVIEDVGIELNVMPADFKLWAQGIVGMGGPGWLLDVGSDKPYAREKTENFNRVVSLIFYGNPEKSGEYPMTLKVVMNGGEKVLQRKFTIKFVDE